MRNVRFCYDRWSSKITPKKPVLLFKLKFDHKALVLNDQAFASFNGPLKSEMDKILCDQMT